MNRVILYLTSAAALPLLADASLKGAALLLLAGTVVLLMRRSSAAARHMVWLAAVVALLLVPVLAVVLPGWRVLPQWAVVEPDAPTAAEHRSHEAYRPYEPNTQAAPAIPISPHLGGIQLPPGFGENTPPGHWTKDTPAAAPPQQPVLSPSPASPAPPSPTSWLLPIWLTGCALLLLRLAAAHFLLRRNTRRCEPATGPLAAAFAAAQQESGLRRPVRLLIDNARSIPVVWGILRPTLLLPAEATTWDATQLRSVLLHEFAHLRRRDPLVQFLTQIACALHWFNPLVWLAAWRLHVERERACDDMVLASGVRPSTYAEHLLHIATQLSPARWTQACGLAMARKSSLEGRLLAVLSDKLNRRRLTRALTAAAILLSAAIAVPIAMLRAQEEKPDAEASETKTEDHTKPATIEGKTADDITTAKLFEKSGNRKKTADDFTAAKFYEKSGNRKAALVYYSSLLSHPVSLHHQEAREGIARLVAAEPALQETATKLMSKLEPANEAQLDWGEPVNGLRGAIIVWSPKVGPQGIALAVQNVSDKPLRFADTTGSKDLRKLYVSDDEGILFALTSNEPTKTDATLQPREVAYLRLIDPVASEKSVEPTMIESLRKDSLQTWRAVLEIQNAPDGAWKGKLTTGETRGAVRPNSPQPKSEEGRALFKLWQDSARLNGDIPGGLVSLLHDKVKEFIRNNEPDAAGAPYAAKMKPLEPRFGEVRDWKPANVVALLDDIAAASTIPLETTLEQLSQQTLQPGQPLPPAYEKADWGEPYEPLDCGLRAAFLLEPFEGTYRLGTEVKARILLQNSGEKAVVFTTTSFQQPAHKATLPEGQKLNIETTFWTTLGRLVSYRLAPGEYCELSTPGIGIGAQNKDREDWANVRAGAWIHCKADDCVLLYPGQVSVSANGEKGEAAHRWWQEFIAARLDREAPVPSGQREREYLLYRVVRELFGSAPSVEEGNSFAADTSPDALRNLAAILSRRNHVFPTADAVVPGLSKFVVLPPDPNAAKRVRVASNPGYYNLSDSLKLSVTRRPLGARIINEASLIYFQQGKDNAITKVELPDGYNTWAAAQEPGTTVLWIKQKDLTRRYDFTDPAQIKETRPDGDVPTRVLEAMQPILATPEEAPARKDNPPPAATAPEKKTATHKTARALNEIWQRHARANGDIPGALIGELAAGVKRFIRYNPTWETVPQLNALLPRLDASRDWKAADAIALLDEVAAIKDSPLDMTLSEESDRVIVKGQPLPKELANAGGVWGAPGADGLRVAWDLQPRRNPMKTSALELNISTAAMGEALRARLFLHNSGKKPIVVRVPTFLQCEVKARDVEGKTVECPGISWTTLSSTYTCRLAPGEYVEINTPGIGFGKDAGREPWAGPRIGWNVLTQPGGSVRLEHAPVPLDGSESGRREDAPFADGPDWWPACIKARLARELPLPANATERARLLERAADDLFGSAPTPEEREAFAKVTDDNSLAAFSAKLAQRPGIVSFFGKLKPVATWFKIAAADANADKRPRVALSPGEYPLPTASTERGSATLKIVGKPVGDRHTNDAQLIFEATEFTGARAPDPHKLELPDGWGTWAIVCRPTDGFLYVLHKGGVRKIDLTKPREVTDTPATDLPAEFRDEAKRQLDAAGVSAAQQAEIFEKPAPPAATPEQKTSQAAPVPTQPITDGKFSAQVLRAEGLDPVVILTGRALTASPDSTSRSGAVTMAVETSANTETIRYTWPEDAPGFLDLKAGGYPVSRFDLSRGRVFVVHFEKLEFSADVFQVPAAVKVPAITSPETLTQAAAAVTAWHAASDDRALWECSRVVVPASEYKNGQPLDAAAEEIVWGEVNDVGLRLGLGGLEPGASFPVGQQLPVKQYIRNDSTKTITFSPTQIFNEGVGGELVRTADGKKFPHKKGYPWQGFFDRFRLAPGHYIALGSGPMRTIMAEKDGSSPGGMDMMAHGFTVLPGEYTLQLTHDIGQFQRRPVNFHFGDPRGAPGLGEWTGVLKSATVPLRLVDQQVKTAKAGDSETFGRYMIAFDKGVLKLRHYNGYPKMSRTGDPWEAQSRDWKIPAPDGEYVAAWAVGGHGLWVKDASGVTHLIVKDVLKENGKWTLDQASGELGGIPAGVRAALQLPPLTAPQAFDFKKLPAVRRGAAKIEGGFFEMAVAPATVLRVPHKGGGFFVDSGTVTYGPAEGNPVVELGLTNLLRTKLAETPNTAGLEMLRHMIADGRGSIRDCGFRLLADLKAPQAPFDFDAVFNAMINASIEDEHGPKELSPEAHQGYTWFLQVFHSTRNEWERTRPLLAADRYQPGAIPGAEPAIVWTAGPDGLSLGVSGLPADTNLVTGKSVPVVVYLRNDRTAPVKLSSPTEHNPVVQISLTDAAGKSHRAIYRFGSPLTGYRHHELAPGSAAKVATFDLETYATPEEASGAEPKEGKAHNPRLAVPAGSYDLHLEYRNYQESPVPQGAASEWTGKLTARPVPMKIAAKSVAILTPAMLSGFWSNGELRRDETVAVSFGNDRSKARKDLDSRSNQYLMLVGEWDKASKIVQDRLVNAELKAQKQKEMQKLTSEIKALEREIDEFRRRRSKQLQEQVMRMRKGLLDDGGPRTADVYIGSGGIGLITTIELAEDRTAASVKSRETNVGRLVAGENGALVFEIAASGDQPARSVPLQQRPDEETRNTTATELDATRKVRPGLPLPKELENAAWGTPAENGLRAAWLLEPRAEQYAHGTVLKARLLFHNSGKEAVVFQTETWHQYDGHKALDAKGAEIKVSGPRYTGITPMATFRLAPGEYCEVTGHGIAIGAGEYEDERGTGSVGAIIEAKEGDTVTLSHTVDVAYGGWTRPDDPNDPAELRKKQIAERVAREAPLPAAAADRELLIRRVTLDLTGVAPTPEEIAAFTTDQSPDALVNLTTRLQNQPAVKQWAGKLPTGETKFRVLPADPNAAKKPRMANAPGRYVLGDSAQLQITQVTEGDTRTNSAEIIFLSPDPKQESPHKPHEIALPDGLNNYAIVWERSSGSLMVVERGSVRTINFADPANVTEERAKVNLAPMYRQLLPPGLLHEQNAVAATDNPKTGAVKLTPESLIGAWRGTVNGENLMLSFHRPPVETDVQCDIYFGEATIGALAGFTIAEDGGSAEVVQNSAGGGMKFGTLIPDEAGKVKLELFGRQKGQQELILTRDVEQPATGPRQKEARELFDMWKLTVNADGTIPGTFIGRLASEVRAYVKAHPNLDSAAKLPKLLPRFVTSRDWTQAEAIKLLDDVAYYATEPIKACLEGEAKVSQSVPTPPVPSAFNPGAKPVSTRLSNDKYSAYAVQAEKVQSANDVNFVLLYEGALSTGMSESWSDTSKRWTFEGNIHLVDLVKTKAAGHNVDKRVIAVKYTSDAPTKLFLDGKEYDLDPPRRVLPTGLVDSPGRVFILRDEGEPLQTLRTLPLQNEKDLTAIGDFAVNDRQVMEARPDDRRVLAMEGWVLAWDEQGSIKFGGGDYVPKMRIFADGRVLVLNLNNAAKARELKIKPEEVTALLKWLAEEQHIGEWKPEKKLVNGKEFERGPVQNMWDRETEVLFFMRDGKRHGLAVESIEPGAQTFTPIRERLMRLAKEAAAN